jgi:hypothetical protein
MVLANQSICGNRRIEYLTLRSSDSAKNKHFISFTHSFKSPAIAAAIARYSLLRQDAAICVHVQFSRYVPL